jgi:hypothetical protein
LARSTVSSTILIGHGPALKEEPKPGRVVDGQCHSDAH